MPPINNLNPPPNPFWAFVADMQEHPWFATGTYPPQYAPPQQQPNQAHEHGAEAAGASNTEKQTPNVEDPPEVDPATLRQDREQGQGPHGCGRRGRHHRDSSSDEEGGRRRGWHGRRADRRWQRAFGDSAEASFPFGGRPPWGPEGQRGEPGHPFPPPGFGPGAHGHGRGGFHHRGGPPHHFRGHPWSHAHRHGHAHGHRGPSPPPPPPGPAGFDLPRFLNDLGSRIGMDLSGAVEGLGLDKFMPSSNSEVDFEPKVDIFDRENDYILHVSLPGAKKSDVGVDWDGEHSVLRVAGVVHRPEVDERMLEQLVVDGRKRETGVFEKTIKLGTRRDPAIVDVAGIKAKMADGVLIVTVPKTEKQHWKRDVPIAKSATPGPARNEKHVMFDMDRDMIDLTTADEPDHEIQMVDHVPAPAPVQAPVAMQVEKEKETESKGKQKEIEHQAEKERTRRGSTGTLEAEQENEHLPTYKAVEQHEREHDASDWENFGSDDEGEFVKINVD